MVKVLPAECALNTCSISKTNCTDPNYPLYAFLVLWSEAVENNANFESMLPYWQSALSTNVGLIAREVALGDINDYYWTITEDIIPPFPCNLNSDVDSCLTFFWSEPGTKSVMLTVIDNNGCQSTYEEIIQVMNNNCDTPVPVNIQVIPVQQNCNINASICTESGVNGQLIIAPDQNGALGYYTY